MEKQKRVIVTVGSGFIGSVVVRMLAKQDVEVFNTDKLSYAGNLTSVVPETRIGTNV